MFLFRLHNQQLQNIIQNRDPKHKMSTGAFSFDTLPKVVNTILTDASENHELEQMLTALADPEESPETSQESDELRSAVTSWFQKTEKEASGAKSYAVASEIILNRLPELLHMYQHISTMCIDMVGRDEITIPDGGLWWYSEEKNKQDGDDYQGAVFQTFMFFGLSDLLCAIVSLGALGIDHSDLLKSPECEHEPFTALVLAQSYELIDRINIESLGTKFLEYVCATGFACKVLPDMEEVAHALAYGYDGRKYLRRGVKNPYMEHGTPLHGFVEVDKRSSQDSWAACCAAHVVLEMGGSLMTPNEKLETPIQLVSMSDGIVFAYFMHYLTMQGIKDLTNVSNKTIGGNGSSGSGNNGGNVEESKEAATKAEVEELRMELRETKQQFGNILLLFGKILGLQATAKGNVGKGKSSAGKKKIRMVEEVRQEEEDDDDSDANSPDSAESEGEDEDVVMA